eukprot:5095033-Amphidinium_carterae.1
MPRLSVKLPAAAMVLATLLGTPRMELKSEAAYHKSFIAACRGGQIDVPLTRTNESTNSIWNAQ